LLQPQILPAFASIASQKFGINENVAFIIAFTLQECKYKLKTLLGVSDEYYKHCKIFPIYGAQDREEETLQQYGASSPVSCLIVTPPEPMVPPSNLQTTPKQSPST
jgi:hypothetical protein